MPNRYAEDRAEIENLQARYLFALDWQDADVYAGTFAEDGVLDWARGVVKGRNAIREEMETLKKVMFSSGTAAPSGPPIRLRHYISNLVLKIDGDRASGRAYWHEMKNDGPERSVRIVGYGHYDDELVRVNGEWLFSFRRINNVQLPGRAGAEENPAW